MDQDFWLVSRENDMFFFNNGKIIFSLNPNEIVKISIVFSGNSWFSNLRCWAIVLKDKKILNIPINNATSEWTQYCEFKFNIDLLEYQKKRNSPSGHEILCWQINNLG